MGDDLVFFGYSFWFEGEAGEFHVFMVKGYLVIPVSGDPHRGGAG
jgi:hypothetical protein